MNRTRTTGAGLSKTLTCQRRKNSVELSRTDQNLICSEETNMKCNACPDYHAGTCTAIGEGNCAFPVTPESECVLDRIEREEERNENT